MSLQPGIWYVVTKGSNCGTFCVGDKIKLLDDGCIITALGQGWLDRDDVPGATESMEVELDKQWITNRRKRLERELKALNKALCSD